MGAVFSQHQEVLKETGSEPKVYIMDNECSSDLKEAMGKNEIDFQLDLPHMHRRNTSERAIRTYKTNFIPGFSTTYTNL